MDDAKENLKEREETKEKKEEKKLKRNKIILSQKELTIYWTLIDVVCIVGPDSTRLDSLATTVASV